VYLQPASSVSILSRSAPITGSRPVAAASYLAMMGVFNFAGTITSGWLPDRFDNRILLAWYYGLRGLSLIWLPFSSFDVYALSIWAIFFGLDFVATVPPTVKLSAQHFGSAKAPIVVGWVFASHQLGGAIDRVCRRCDTRHLG
jgi:predicted MFS family arabinose efflux permease